MLAEHVNEYPTIRLYTGNQGQFTQYHIKDDDSNLNVESFISFLNNHGIKKKKVEEVEIGEIA